MITIDFTLSHSNIKIINRPLVTSQSKNYVTAHFEPLTDDWISPITAIFAADGKSYTVLLNDNNTCTVPWEVLKHAGAVNVSAFCGDLHTANIAQFNVAQSGYIDSQTPSKPTPTVYEQILEQYESKQDKLTAGNGIKIEDNIISATGGGSGGADGKSAYEIALEHGFVGTEEDWLASLKGADGKNGVDGKDGVDGHTPEKGVDYFTDSDKTELTAEVTANLNPKFDEKQDKLISSENIKTVNGESLIGSGNIDINRTDTTIELITSIVTDEAVSNIVVYDNIDKPLRYVRLIMVGTTNTTSTGNLKCVVNKLDTFNTLGTIPKLGTNTSNYGVTTIFNQGVVSSCTSLGAAQAAGLSHIMFVKSFYDNAINHIVVGSNSSAIALASGFTVKLYGVYA